MEPTATLLVTLTGRDRPGVTAALLGALAAHDVQILDLEQLVVRGRLVLAVLVGVQADAADEVRRTARRAAADLDMDVETVAGALEDVGRRRDRFDVTVLGAVLPAAAVAALARVIADHGGNIDRIHRVAAYPVTALALEGSGADPATLRRALAVAATQCGVDVAVQRAGLGRRGQRLVVMDVDSTLIRDEVIDLLAQHAGVGAQVAGITEAAMRGELDFAESLHRRVALLRGVPESALAEVRDAVVLTRGARTLCRTLKRLGYRIALVSGGFEQVVRPLAAELGVDEVRANVLEVRDGRLTGRVVGPVVDRAGKRAALEEFAAAAGVPLSRTVAIGDGANDLDMLAAAGLGVAFNAKPAVRAAADTAVSVPYLDSVLYLLGITREEVEEADAAAARAVHPAAAAPGPPRVRTDR